MGFETDTQDKYGEIINESTNLVTKEDIENALEAFVGNIEQVPPMYSAIKHKGKKLYELARQGKTVERKAREVTIYDISVIDIKDNKKILFDVICSKGTYIRTLCNDIGNKLGTYGHMSFLLRTEVDSFSLSSSYTLEEIAEYSTNDKIRDILLPLDYPLHNMKSISIDENKRFKLLNGVKVTLQDNNEISSKPSKTELCRIYSENTFIGIGTITNSDSNITLKMEKVLV